MEPPRFAEAGALLARHLPKTRLVPAASFRKRPDQQVFLKLESELPTGSFKVRGALYALEANLRRRGVTEVVASSTGNHGAAVAYAARLLGVRARIYLPENSNPVKREKIARLGAEIVETGALDLTAAFAAADGYARESGAFFLNDASDPDLPAGPGTIAHEILDQLPEAARIYVPMGDTALIRGVAEAAKQRSRTVKITGVQSERAPSYFLSWKAGKPVATDTCNTIADGLATRTPLEENVTQIRRLVDDVVLVSEEEMLEAIARLLMDEHLVAEPAGAAAAAAFAKSGEAVSGPAVLLLSGANVERSVLRQALGRAEPRVP